MWTGAGSINIVTWRFGQETFSTFHLFTNGSYAMVILWNGTDWNGDITSASPIMHASSEFLVTSLEKLGISTMKYSVCSVPFRKIPEAGQFSVTGESMCTNY